MRWSIPQRLLAEFLGTFGLVLSVTWAAVLSLNIPGVDPTTRYLMIALAIGLGLVGLLYALAEVSGGHFNPAVSVGAWVAGRLPGRDLGPYILAQVAGGLLAVATLAGVAHGSGSLWASATGPSTAFASQGYAGNGSPYTVAVGSVFLLEVVLTFVFVLVILLSTRAEGAAKNLAPLGIGVTLTMIHLVSLPIDGTSVNPARSFTPAILAAFFPADRWAIAQDWLFWVAPILGALIAALAERALRPRP